MNQRLTNNLIQMDNSFRVNTLFRSKIKSLLLFTLLSAITFYTASTSANPAAITAFEQQNIETAKALFQQSLEQNKEDVSALYYLARIALIENELDEAEDHINLAQQLAPEDAAIQYKVAQVMGLQARDSSIFSAPGYAKKSLKAYIKAAEFEPDNISYRQGLMNFYLMAPGIVGGDDELALREAKAIDKLDPVKGFLALGNVYRSTEDDEKLKQHYTDAAKTFPDNEMILFRRGLYYQSQENYKLANIDFHKVFAIEPEGKDGDENADGWIQFSALYQVGRSSVLSGEDIDQGIQALQTFLDKAPDNSRLPSPAWAKFRLGLLHAKNGDKALALKLYKEAKNETKDKSLLKMLKKKMRKRS